MSTEKEDRIARAKEGLEECKGHLRNLVPEWDGLSDFMKGNMIGSICIYIHFCDCFTQITQEFVETIFRENGGWAVDHPLTAGVIQRLREWRALHK
jgi:hypothetical protein